MSWSTMDDAPRDGTIVDVWIRGTRDEVEFYCHTPPVAYRDGTRGGVSCGWIFRQGRWRPNVGLECMPCSTEPAYWRPPHSPPDQDARELT